MDFPSFTHNAIIVDCGGKLGTSNGSSGGYEDVFFSGVNQLNPHSTLGRERHGCIIYFNAFRSLHNHVDGLRAVLAGHVGPVLIEQELKLLLFFSNTNKTQNVASTNGYLRFGV